LEVVEPFFAAGFKFGVEAPRFKPFEDFDVGTLGLTVASGIGD
jgi:hypothetical protein